MIKINNTTKRDTGTTVQIAYIPDIQQAANALCAELSATKTWYDQNHEAINQAASWVSSNSESFSTLYSWYTDNSDAIDSAVNWYAGGAETQLNELYDWYSNSDAAGQLYNLYNWFSNSETIDAAVSWVAENSDSFSEMYSWCQLASYSVDMMFNWYSDTGSNAVAKLDSVYSWWSNGGATVALSARTTPESGYATTYDFHQGSNLVGSINIPKDFLVKSAALCAVTVVDVPYTGAKVGDKYIDFVINAKDASATAEHIYLPVNDLVDVYTAQQNATQVQLAIGSDNVISAAIVAGSIGTTELANSAVVTAKIADANVTTAKIADANVTTAKIADAAVTTDKIGLVDTADSTKSYTLAVTEGRLELVEL